jgi:hypothetical protein
MFMDCDGIRACAARLDPEIVAPHDGDKPHIPLPQPLTLDDGSTIMERGNHGQWISDCPPVSGMLSLTISAAGADSIHACDS